ncbi:MAG: hypothetical protein V4684_15170 [Pseudomonadota bacterium]
MHATPSSAVQAGPQEPGVRVLSDRELLVTVLNARSHEDLQRPQALENLAKTLANHTSDFVGMSDNDVVKLFVAVHELSLNADVTIARIDAALTQRIASMDLDTVMLLARDSKRLPADPATALQAKIQPFMPALEKRLMKAPVEQMKAGFDLRSPAAISTAIQSARAIFDTLADLSPRNPPMTPEEKLLALENLISDALSSVPTPVKTEMIMVLAGKSAELRGTGAVIKDKANPLSASVTRNVDGANHAKSRETLNLRLFQSAVVHAVSPRWSEPTGARDVTTRQLFGDGTSWPPISARMIEEASKAANDYYALLSTFHLIKDLPSMTQKQAEQLAGPLRAIVTNNKMGERLGSTLTPFSLDLSSLKSLPAEQRPAAFCALLAPTRIQAQQRIVVEVNSKRVANENKEKSAAVSRARLDKRKTDGQRFEHKLPAPPVVSNPHVEPARNSVLTPQREEDPGPDVNAALT